MNVLIIGGGGYLGSVLYQSLQNHSDIELLCMVDKLIYNQGPLIAPHLNKNDAFWQYDVDEIPDNILSKFDVIFPLAAYVGAPVCEKYPKEAWRVNTESIYRLIKRLSPNQRVIFPCTNSGYGIQDNICTEETPMKSISLYGRSKEEAEKIVMEHPQATSFRLATLYGLSPRHRIDLMVNYFTYLATCYGKIELFEGNFLRNFVHVDDVARIFTYCIDNKTTYGKIYNLGRDEENTSKFALVEQINKYIPVEVTYSDKKDPDQRNYNVSSEKLFKETGYKANIRLSSGIVELKRYYEKFPHHTSQAHKDFLQYIKNA